MNSAETEALKKEIIDNVTYHANTKWWLLSDYLDLLINSARQDQQDASYGIDSSLMSQPITVIPDTEFFND